MRAARGLVLLSLLGACGGDASLEPDGGSGADASQSPADAGLVGALLGDFQLTYYYIAEEVDHLDAGSPGTPLYGSGCAVIAMVTSAFAGALKIEGTGQLVGGVVINYAGSCHCPTATDTTTCYAPVDASHPWGSGSANRPLVPFRSIAIDKTVPGMVIGKRYWVAELESIPMPGGPPTGGFVHDGCVTADDTGSGITGLHIDFFSLFRRYYLDLDKLLGLTQVTVYAGGGRCP